jgi:hypothetical protein
MLPNDHGLAQDGFGVSLVETICRMILKLLALIIFAGKKSCPSGAVGPQDPHLRSLDELDLLGKTIAIERHQRIVAGVG